MKAKIYYQPVELNVLALIEQEDLEVDFDKAVFIIDFYDPDINSKEKLADRIFALFNHEHKHKELQAKYKEVGHTSMSIGDYIEFEDGEILVCASTGWELYECRYCGSKHCRFDCDESQAGSFN